MHKPEVTDLTLRKMQYGTHQVPWDLRILLYKGGAGTHRSNVADLIDRGHLGAIISERVPLVERIHGVISSKLDRGVSPHTLVEQLQLLWTFVKWVDENDATLTLEDTTLSFRAWTESLLHRVRIIKDLSEKSAYAYAVVVADVIARALDFPQKNPSMTLLRLTRMRSRQSRKRVLGIQADKQNLEQTFAFGRFLGDLCLGITSDAVRGPLPLTIPLRDGRAVILAGCLKNPALDPTTINDRTRRERAVRSRAALEESASAIDNPKRTSLFNLRVEAELLIFVAQSGMNLGQAAKLRRQTLRWQTDGDNLLAFRVYKGRRGGDAVFRCFKEYRAHWDRYLVWLRQTGLAMEHDNLFPFLYPGKIPASHAYPHFTGVRKIAANLGVKYFGPKALRKTRINWLLRRSRDPALTAEQAAHSKQTLLKSYEEPHFQSAVAEIVRFHAATDPSSTPPGPGICAANGGKPTQLADTPPEAPRPDCISPEGCLFCAHHRDVMSADYCWKLASHARLKALEVSLYKPTRTNHIHPGNRVIDRINDKLNAIGEGSDIRALWVRDARDTIRAGHYHPVWNGHIQLMEALV